MATQGSESSPNVWPQRTCDCRFCRDCVVRTSGSKKNPGREYFASTCNDSACNGFVGVDEYMERNHRSSIPTSNVTTISLLDDTVQQELVMLKQTLKWHSRCNFFLIVAVMGLLFKS